MIKSQLLLDIFNIMFDDLEYEENLRNQIQFLEVNETEHTGIGLFVNFKKKQEIEKYRVSIEKNENGNFEIIDSIRLNGVELRNIQLNIEADVDVVVKDGIINYVEVWNRIGEQYPENEPTKYELEQVWVDSKKRKIIRN